MPSDNQRPTKTKGQDWGTTCGICNGGRNCFLKHFQMQPTSNTVLHININQDKNTSIKTRIKLRYLHLSWQETFGLLLASSYSCACHNYQILRYLKLPLLGSESGSRAQMCFWFQVVHMISPSLSWLQQQHASECCLPPNKASYLGMLVCMWYDADPHMRRHTQQASQAFPFPNSWAKRIRLQMIDA